MFASCSRAPSLRAGIINAYGTIRGLLPVSRKEGGKLAVWSDGYRRGREDSDAQCQSVIALRAANERAEKAEAALRQLSPHRAERASANLEDEQ